VQTRRGEFMPTKLDRQRLMPKGMMEAYMPKDFRVPFSIGWRVGNLVFSGGHIAVDENHNIIGPGDIEVQTRTVFQNLTETLHEAGADWRHVVKLNTYYVCDEEGDALIEFWKKMTRVRLEFLPDPGPAATALRLALVPTGVLVEIDAIAVID
jgi:2-iminobutanoate/2-iminopropanoate deaminase